ncbi:hypothetical protein GETHLI_32190 [Geothrix limicola]|uniref:DUF5077 domain-containing protein n=1 Tax=Geothrix limicola TaxID=2927978 RepID=A0ABQ5QJE4_9BACT|nr:DUF3472 domain-containing protein [Geothrix limicola]GLH74717.1 hypothetical protein GETHLI_32190 [Geothrix limicola]
MSSILRRGATLLLLAAAPLSLRADEKLKDIACRSVHLGYPAPESLAFYNEVKVEKTALGTYFMVCGWKDGYFGIQEGYDGHRQIIFSVWDAYKGDDPGAVPDGQRVILRHQDPEVRVGRFGGEGTGGQSFLPFPWKVGVTYRFMVSAKPIGRRTEFSGWVFDPARKAWRKLVTFSTVTEGRALKDYYSFVEDFKRDRASTKLVRQAAYGPGWALGLEGEWRLLDRAKFTADRNPVLNIDAGIRDGRYFLATGGPTQNLGTKLWDTMSLPAEPRPARPADLPQVVPNSQD